MLAGLLRVTYILGTCFALIIQSASPTGAQSCAPGYKLCADGLCYSLGAQCCAVASGGGACRIGYQCFRDSHNSNFCCQLGHNGYLDRGCAPSGISDYCGQSRYCWRGRCATADNGDLVCRTQ